MRSRSRSAAHRVGILLLVAACTWVTSALAGPEEPPWFTAGLTIGATPVGLAVYSGRTDVVFGSVRHWFQVHGAVTIGLILAPLAGMTFWIIRRPGRITQTRSIKDAGSS